MIGNHQNIEYHINNLTDLTQICATQKHHQIKFTETEILRQS